MSTGGESNKSRGRPRGTGPAVLSPGEFEVMELFWRHGPQNSREIYEKQAASRGLAYTTVMTFLEKLQRKGFLLQQDRGKGNPFLPQVDRQEALRRCLDHFIRSYFGNNRSYLLDFLGAPAAQPHVTVVAKERKKPIQEKGKEAPSAPTLDPELL